MKKIIAVIIFSIAGIASGFAKELDGKNLKAVNKILEANLQVSAYETLEEKLFFLEESENDLRAMGADISEEARLVCKSILETLKETVKAEDQLKQEQVQKKKNTKKEKDPEAEAKAMAAFKEFQDFEQAHKDLSSHFYFHYTQAEFGTVPYLPFGKQMELLSKIVEDYKKIEEMNPNYGENLFFLGMSLYMAPKIAGGDKKAGLEKILKAAQVSETNYERFTSMLIYSQLMFEEKKFEEAKMYLALAAALSPDEKQLKEIQEMNEAGFSFFKASEYKKKNQSK